MRKQICALCGCTVNSKDLEINIRLQVTKNNMVCTECLKTTGNAKPFAKDNIDFI